MGIIMRNGIMYGGGLNPSIIAADYSTSSTYAVNEYCMHDGALYRCTTAISTAEAWNSAHWTEEHVMDQITAILNRQS